MLAFASFLVFWPSDGPARPIKILPLRLYFQKPLTSSRSLCWTIWPDLWLPSWATSWRIPVLEATSIEGLPLPWCERTTLVPLPSSCIAKPEVLHPDFQESRDLKGTNASSPAASSSWLPRDVRPGLHHRPPLLWKSWQAKMKQTLPPKWFFPSCLLFSVAPWLGKTVPYPPYLPGDCQGRQPLRLLGLPSQTLICPWFWRPPGLSCSQFSFINHMWILFDVRLNCHSPASQCRLVTFLGWHLFLTSSIQILVHTTVRWHHHVLRST